MKHTPGQWRAQCLLVWDESRAGCTIAEVNGDSEATDGFIHKFMSREEGEANARLIASAPKLLAACQKILCDYARIGTWSFSGQALELTRKAVAEATKE